jgi:hypothetical protein
MASQARYSAAVIMNGGRTGTSPDLSLELREL